MRARLPRGRDKQIGHRQGRRHFPDRAISRTATSVSCKPPGAGFSSRWAARIAGQLRSCSPQPRRIPGNARARRVCESVSSVGSTTVGSSGGEHLGDRSVVRRRDQNLPAALVQPAGKSG